MELYKCLKQSEKETEKSVCTYNDATQVLGDFRILYRHNKGVTHNNRVTVVPVHGLKIALCLS